MPYSVFKGQRDFETLHRVRNLSAMNVTRLLAAARKAPHRQRRLKALDDQDSLASPRKQRETATLGEKSRLDRATSLTACSSNNKEMRTVMSSGPDEIRREYRLQFDCNDPAWDDPISPTTSSGVLGWVVTHVIRRTSLLAWSLTKIPDVEVADLADSGCVEIRIRTGADFDEPAFKAEVTAVVAKVKLVRCDRSIQGGRSYSSHRPAPAAPMPAVPTPTSL